MRRQSIRPESAPWSWLGACAAAQVSEDGQHAAVGFRVRGEAELSEDLLYVASTVRSAMNSRAAIALFDNPSATKSSTSRSRGVRSASGSVVSSASDQTGHDRRVDN